MCRATPSWSLRAWTRTSQKRWSRNFSRRAAEMAEPNKMQVRIVTAIRRIPRGKVSTYGAVARGAGYPGAARQVVGVLHRSFGLPWHRVLGAGGEIKLRGDSAFEQRFRLQTEKVTFRGRRVDMKQHEYKFPRKSPGKSHPSLQGRVRVRERQIR